MKQLLMKTDNLDAFARFVYPLHCKEHPKLDLSQERSLKSQIKLNFRNISFALANSHPDEMNRFNVFNCRAFASVCNQSS